MRTGVHLEFPGDVMSETLTRHNENERCNAKLQFRGCQQCAKLEFRATFSQEK
ncbi:hypothetical protein U27_00526 [Candidatus Vecturithrix granuli]|uniref:Uncharacterized protein n=1 Tax=Vecturithrix granuli TaxID=1499967 RepID=A0A081C7S4_VECG1|nr:hypothetical protein U27_00526 [Candidatus Vecturithrix granuli]